MLNLKGIDISMHNNAVDFGKVKASGVQVVIIKATEGVDYVDQLFNNYYNSIKDSGLNYGFYHFMSERTDPKQQAQDFWNAIKDKKFNVVPCLDIEVNSFDRTRQQISDRCIEFLEEFKNLSGYDCMIYTGGFFGRDNLDDRVKKYPGWIAHYGVSEPMETGFKVVGHQYTETGAVDGINGQVDLNHFSDEIFINKIEEPAKPKALWEISIQGDEVKALQAELNRQCGANLTVDGFFGDSTLNACITIYPGANGSLTKLVQKRLMNRGYSLAPYGADGDFGGTTVKAIKTLQNCFNLVQDGIIGKATWKSLYGLNTGKF
ncbi:MAG: GH25 family lysozyme [Cetobacterium sp.]